MGAATSKLCNSEYLVGLDEAIQLVYKNEQLRTRRRTLVHQDSAVEGIGQLTNNNHHSRLMAEAPQFEPSTSDVEGESPNMTLVVDSLNTMNSLDEMHAYNTLVFHIRNYPSLQQCQGKTFSHDNSPIFEPL